MKNWFLFPLSKLETGISNFSFYSRNPRSEFYISLSTLEIRDQNLVFLFLLSKFETRISNFSFYSRNSRSEFQISLSTLEFTFLTLVNACTIAIKVTVIMTIILTITVAISKGAMHSSAIVSPNSNPRPSSWPFLSPEIGAVLALLLVPVKQCQALSATPHSTWPEQKWNYESPNKKTLD